MLTVSAEYFTDRTDVQCLHRWQKVLNPALVKGPWTEQVRPSSLISAPLLNLARASAVPERGAGQPLGKMQFDLTTVWRIGEQTPPEVHR
jgi:hypothetical protein